MVFNKELPVKNKDKKKEDPKKLKWKFQPQILDELDKHNRPTQLVKVFCYAYELEHFTQGFLALFNMTELNLKDPFSEELLQLLLN